MVSFLPPHSHTPTQRPHLNSAVHIVCHGISWIPPQHLFCIHHTSSTWNSKAASICFFPACYCCCLLIERARASEPRNIWTNTKNTIYYRMNTSPESTHSHERERMHIILINIWNRLTWQWNAPFNGDGYGTHQNLFCMPMPMDINVSRLSLMCGGIGGGIVRIGRGWFPMKSAGASLPRNMHG